MTEKEFKTIKCETEEEEKEQTMKLLEAMVNAIEGQPFLHAYTAACIRLNEIVRLSNTPQSEIDRIDNLLSTASLFTNNQVPFADKHVDLEVIRTQTLKVVEIADILANTLRGYCDNVVIYSLSLLKNYLVDMEMLSPEDIKSLNKLVKEIEGNLGEVLKMAEQSEGK